MCVLHSGYWCGEKWIWHVQFKFHLMLHFCLEGYKSIYSLSSCGLIEGLTGITSFAWQPI